jgi:hypothetical protein
MNHSKGHKLLSNALIIVINISFRMEIRAMGLGDGFEILDELYSIFFILQKNMR